MRQTGDAGQQVPHGPLHGVEKAVRLFRHAYHTSDSPGHGPWPNKQYSNILWLRESLKINYYS